MSEDSDMCEFEVENQIENEIELKNLFEAFPRRAAVPPELRDRVLAQVSRELAATRARSWERRVAMLAAALLGMALTANAWVTHSSERELVRFFGPPAVSRQLRQWTDAIAEVTGPDLARQLEASLMARKSDPSHTRSMGPQEHLSAIEDLLRELGLA